MRRKASFGLLVLIASVVVVPAFASDWSEKKLDVKAFSSIRSQYISDLEVIGGGQKNAVILSGNPKLFPYVKTSVSGNVLSIRSPRGVHVLVRAAELHDLNVVGEGHVEAKNLAVLGPFSLHTAGAVSVSLTGPVDLAKVTVSGQSKLLADWVDAKHLQVYASGSSHVTLNGRAEQVNYGLYDNSQVNARWLRTEEVVAQTANQSLAMVLPTKGLTAYAADNSRITYYKRPERMTPFSGKYGNVLLAADIE